MRAERNELTVYDRANERVERWVAKVRTFGAKVSEGG